MHVFTGTHGQLITCMLAISGNQPSCQFESSGSTQPHSDETCRYPINH